MRSPRPTGRDANASGTPSPETVGDGVDLDETPSRRRAPAEPVSPRSNMGRKAELPQPVGRKIQCANLRLFMDKLSKRRKRIACSFSSARALRARLSGMAERYQFGPVPCEVLRELLRDPPARVPSTVLRDFIEVSRTYDVGDGTVDVDELLDGSLEVDARFLSRLRVLLQVFALLIWFMLAPTVYCSAADWSVREALFFAVMTISTVGVIEPLPETDELKAFTFFYVLSGMCIVAWICITVVTSVVLRYEAKVRTLLRARSMADLLADDGYGTGGLVRQALEDLVRPGANAVAPEQPEKEAPPLVHGATVQLKRDSAQRALYKAAAALLLMPVLLLIGTVLFFAQIDENAIDYRATFGGNTTVLQSVTIADAFYWALTTCATIGYGDVRMGGGAESSQAPTLIFVLFAVPGCLFALCTIGDAYMQACSADLEAEVGSYSLPPELLVDFDRDGSGVTKMEFLCAMLMARARVTAYDLWEALNHFEQLDVDQSGLLDASKLTKLRRTVNAKKKAPPQSLASWLPCMTAQKEPDEEPTVQTPRSDSVTSPDDAFFPRGERSLQEAGPTSGGFDEARSAASTLLPAEVIAQGSVSFESLEAAVTSATRAGLREPDVWQELINQAGAKVLLQELYHESIRTRQLCDAKCEDLLVAVQLQAQLEHNLRQVAGERQALHGEVRLLQHRIAQMQERVAEGQRKHEDAESRVREAERRCQELNARAQEGEVQRQLADQQRQMTEQHRQAAETRAVELASQVQHLEQLRLEAEGRQRVAESKVQDAERARDEAKLQLQKLRSESAQQLQDVTRRTQEQLQEVAWKNHEQLQQAAVRAQEVEREFEYQVEAKKAELERRCAEIDLQRQMEMRTAILEMQCANGPARGQMGPPRVPSSRPCVIPSRRMRNTKQPWEVWELGVGALAHGAKDHAPSTALLSDKLRGQISYIDQTVSNLEKQEGAAGVPPGWVADAGV